MTNKYIEAQAHMSVAAERALEGKVKGFRRLLPFLGPAFIAAIAYIDPGNLRPTLRLARNMATFCYGSFSYPISWPYSSSLCLQS